MLSGAIDAAVTLSGGTLVVSSGGTLTGPLTIQAGKAVVSGTMAAGQTVSFTGDTGVLKLDNVAGFQAGVFVLATSTQKIDLGGFAHSSGPVANWTQSGTGGTLVIHDDAKVLSLALVGS